MSTTTLPSLHYRSSGKKVEDVKYLVYSEFGPGFIFKDDKFIRDSRSKMNQAYIEGYEIRGEKPSLKVKKTKSLMKTPITNLVFSLKNESKIVIEGCDEIALEEFFSIKVEEKIEKFRGLIANLCRKAHKMGYMFAQKEFNGLQDYIQKMDIVIWKCVKRYSDQSDKQLDILIRSSLTLRYGDFISEHNKYRIGDKGILSYQESQFEISDDFDRPSEIFETQKPYFSKPKPKCKSSELKRDLGSYTRSLMSDEEFNKFLDCVYLFENEKGKKLIGENEFEVLNFYMDIENFTKKLINANIISTINSNIDTSNMKSDKQKEHLKYNNFIKAKENITNALKQFRMMR